MTKWLDIGKLELYILNANKTNFNKKRSWKW